MKQVKKEICETFMQKHKSHQYWSLWFRKKYIFLYIFPNIFITSFNVFLNSLIEIAYFENSSLQNF